MRYAFVQNGVVVEAWSRNPAELFDAGYASQFVNCPDEVEQGWTFDGTTWAAPVVNLAAIVRAERKRRLEESDWTQLADAPVDKARWAVYRQALRDIPSQPGFPGNVTWPTL